MWVSTATFCQKKLTFSVNDTKYVPSFSTLAFDEWSKQKQFFSSIMKYDKSDVEWR